MNRGIFRMLLMFGPMLFRQFQKWQRSREKSQPTQQYKEVGPRNNRDSQQGQYDQPQTQRQPKDNEFV